MPNTTQPYVNPNKALQENVQAPAAQTPITPAPQQNTPAAPMGAVAPTPSTVVNVNTTPQTSETAPGATQNQSTPQSSTLPNTNLQPGSQGQDVKALQDYLSQHGYLTAEQIGNGSGTYGPQTTSAVAKLQQDLGLNPTTGAGFYGPQTQSALAQKYGNIFSTVKNQQAPDQAGVARATIDSAFQAQESATTDPVFGAMASSMGPIMQSLTQVLNNINNPALAAVSLQQEYQQMAQQYQIPQLQSGMLNMQNIMNGTTGDIRDEITKAGGTATESQVQAMSAARNNVILKQYNALSTQYQAATTNVQNMMQYASTDQSNALQRQNMTASITESMASIQNQMLQMGMTMQNNARSAVQYNVTQMGYQGLAESAQGNSKMLGYYENVLGLAPGTLSDPNAVAGMDTYKNQQLQINNYRAAISAYQAGYGGAMNPAYGQNPIPGSPGAPVQGQVGVTPVDPTQLVRPSYVDNATPLTMSAEQMNQYMGVQKAATIDPGTNNIVAPGVGYYMQQADGSYVLKSALPSDTDTQYNSIKQTIAAAPVFNGSPRVTGQWTTSTNKELSAFKQLGTYQVLSTVAPYMANIRAAQTNPGSISDLELLDSYVRLSKGGTGQVTGDQVDIALRGASISDSASVMEQKLQNGGVLSSNQRAQLVQLASQVYNENADDYKKLYVQATQGLQQQGIPVQFWSNLPDLNSLLSGNSVQ